MLEGYQRRAWWRGMAQKWHEGGVALVFGLPSFQHTGRWRGDAGRGRGAAGCSESNTPVGGVAVWVALVLIRH